MLGIHLNKTNIKLNKEPSLLYHESHFGHPSKHLRTYLLLIGTLKS